MGFSSNKVVNDSYRICRRMQLRHDPTYFAATACLPVERRPALYALYGYVRGADEIADNTGLNGQRRAALDAWQRELEEGLKRGYSTHPVIGALVDAGPRYGMPLELLPEYMESMRADCDEHVRMRSQEQLDHYMQGTATVGPVAAPLLDAPDSAIVLLKLLGVAFQLTNFIRDVPVDWQMGRIYLPGLEERDLNDRTASAALRNHVAQQVVRARVLFAESEGLAQLLPAAVRPGIKVARAVYLKVLDRVEENGYDVVTRSSRLRPWEAVGATSWALVS
ncbi:MAG: squalene/phytoene synthase family protein [Solirubrobacteraceae bacterium]|nr:squalene/phytoene synthase family protein [Solirubrobacteraceae bacterium]